MKTFKFIMMTLVVCGGVKLYNDHIAWPANFAPPSENAIAYSEEDERDFAFSLARATVEVHTAKGFGSGMIISRDGWLLTAAHVVEGHEVVEIIPWRGAKIAGRVVYISKKYDFALVKVGAVFDNILGISSAEPLPGQRVHVMGHPYYRSYIYFKGLVRDAVPQNIIGWLAMDVDITIAPGMSGGPLVDDLGRIVGIVSAGDFPSDGFFSSAKYTNRAYFAPAYLFINELRAALRGEIAHEPTSQATKVQSTSIRAPILGPVGVLGVLRGW